jgi:nucleoside 2-deoxyribosyltransferase
MLNIPVEWFRPKPGGRDEVFHRDIEMVSHADVVICVFSEDQPMEGGTAHIVEKAQDRHVPVYAYTFDANSGHWARLGEWDPDNTWANQVPSG